MKKQFLQLTSVITLTLMVLFFMGTSAKGQNKNTADTAKQQKEAFIYTCTMHPEIQLDKPGKCPKCGMNLVKKPKVSEKKNENYKTGMMHSMMSGSENSEKNKSSGDSTINKSVIYTCSMHPEIQVRQPGNCPKCGMTLIKKSAAIGKKEKQHLMSSM
ncbi:MAG: hypothetical protein HYR66_02155 [Sphingobacteriales bacterium]|nr:hypothetical protein [Sphingobacteriales bacterium]MBI3718581.1 hypothetical protein [Sphingobacteriales bacterium]